MPMAFNASALLRLASTMWLRRAACIAASSVGWRTLNSVSTVNPTRTRAPAVAVTPMSGWNRKQMPT